MNAYRLGLVHNGGPVLDDIVKARVLLGDCEAEMADPGTNIDDLAAGRKGGEVQA